MTNKVDNFKWLAGALEVGGDMGFKTQHQTKKGVEYIYAYPRIRIGDEDKKKVSKLTDLFEGSITKSDNTYSWFTTNVGGAVEIAEGIAPYAPSRRETITAYRNFENEPDPLERLRIAEENGSFDRVTVTTRSDYDELVQSVDFLTGVLEFRGAIYFEKYFANGHDTGKRRPSLNIGTSNLGLLEAAWNLFERAGNIGVRNYQGTELKVLIDGLLLVRILFVITH